MFIAFWEHKVGSFVYTVKEWTCCGYVWQLILSGNYINGHNWNPICPICGKKSLHKWSTVSGVVKGIDRQ